MSEEYKEYVRKITPHLSALKQMVKAFFVGGLICVLGDSLLRMWQYRSLVWMSSRQEASVLCIDCIKRTSTGFHVYSKLVTFAGAGALDPITGFANSVAAPAIEFKKEGWVFGVGCKIFTIAGPVILYGIFCCWVLWIIYWIRGHSVLRTYFRAS